MSFVDLNRSGVALMEIVSKPDMRSSEEAKAYVTKLRTILRYLGTCDGDMEKGNLRADVNVSVRRPGEPLGTRCEIKNVNSIRFIGQAIEYEARRQIGILEDGGSDRPGDAPVRSRPAARRARCAPRRRRTTTATSPIPTCCRSSSTRPMWTTSRRTCRNCRTPRRRASSRTTGCRAYDAGVLVAERRRGRFLRGRSPAGRDGKAAANWVINELFGRLNREGREIADSPVSAGSSAASSTSSARA